MKKHVSYRKAENLQMDGYGYLFWHLKSGIYMANGKYGQYCIVIPDKDAVISINSTEKIRNEKYILIYWKKFCCFYKKGK